MLDGHHHSLSKTAQSNVAIGVLRTEWVENGDKIQVRGEVPNLSLDEVLPRLEPW